MTAGVIFSIQSRSDQDAKGNTQYLRHYGEVFDRFLFLNVLGKGPSTLLGDRVEVRSIGLNRNFSSLLISPLTIAIAVRGLHRSVGERPVIMTADQWFCWWSGCLIRLLGYRFAILPVCIPEVIYRVSDSTPTRLPKWLEHGLRRISLSAASALVITSSQKAYVEWAASNRKRHKMSVFVEVMAESLPSPSFIAGVDSALSARRLRPNGNAPKCRCVYVGRLHAEKRVGDIISALSIIENESVFLDIVGDGPELESLRSLVVELELDSQVRFIGAVDNDLLPELLSTYDVFIAPLAGTSLREAAACGLAVVTYDSDWVSSAFTSEVDAMLVPDGSVRGLAEAISVLSRDPELRASMAYKSTLKARRIWCRTLRPEDVLPIVEALQGDRRHKPRIAKRRDPRG